MKIVDTFVGWLRNAYSARALELTSQDAPRTLTGGVPFGVRLAAVAI